LGEPFRQDRGPQARPFQAHEDVRDLGKRIKRQVKVHQPIAQAGLFDIQCLQREIESIAGNLPEIRVPALQRTKPGILQLLVAPQRGQLVDAVPEHVTTALGRSGKIEQRAVGIEDAGLHAEQRSLVHADYLTYAHLQWFTVQ
jgi:hypothetical protein